MRIARERIEAREEQDPRLWTFIGRTETRLTSLEDEQQDHGEFLGVLQHEVEEGRCRCGEGGVPVRGASPASLDYSVSAVDGEEVPIVTVGHVDEEAEVESTLFDEEDADPVPIGFDDSEEAWEARYEEHLRDEATEEAIAWCRANPMRSPSPPSSSGPSADTGERCFPDLFF